MNNSERIIKIYGITKDPKTNNFIMVMEYANNGNLRQKLNKDFHSLSWVDKFDILRGVALGLNDIHKMGLTHQDFHSGNILNEIEFDDFRSTNMLLKEIEIDYFSSANRLLKEIEFDDEFDGEFDDFDYA